MAKLEANKHLPPKFSPLCNDLAEFFGENITTHKPSEITRPVSLIPQTRFPELTKIKEFRIDNNRIKENIRIKRQRPSLDPPKQYKSEYYEKALEKYFNLSQHYNKSSEDFEELTKSGLRNHSSNKST